MPEIARFLGIIIRMFYDDHAPPHFHVYYNDQQAIIEIDSLVMKQGKLSPRILGLVMEWAALHIEELRDDWKRAENGLQLLRIKPLE